VPYLRFTRDRRGYEHTYLMHVGGPGQKPRVLYWYRTAPGVRIGRPALDEDAIHLIEEQHPDIEFDWSHILEIGALATPEVEAKVEPRKRKPRRDEGDPREREARGSREPRREPPARPPQEARPADTEHLGADADPEGELVADPAESAEVPEPPAPSRASEFDEDAVGDARSLPRGGLLEELVGVGIATRLRARHAELLARLHEAPGDAMTQEEWATRLDAINPDVWVTPEEVLRGVQHADRLFDQLRREILGG
jgi:hypothetical protein